MNLAKALPPKAQFEFNHFFYENEELFTLHWWNNGARYEQRKLAWDLLFYIRLGEDSTTGFNAIEFGPKKPHRAHLQTP